MLDNRIYTAGIIIAILAALILRLPGLSDRPMHHDEANQAVRCSELQRSFVYAYDPTDHHGPSLYYFSLPSAWLFAGRDFGGTHELTFRLVPVLFCVLLLLLFLLISDGIGRDAVVISMLFAAVSPVLVWYSRFYIHEMLLICFTAGVIASGWRYLQSGRPGWAAMSGLFLGLMISTKETWIIAAAAMLIAAGATAVWCRLDRRTPRCENEIQLYDCIAALVAAIAVIFLLYSSFCMNMRGLIDAVRSYAVYFKRGISGGAHIHPWYYYIGLLRYESGITCFALIGAVCISCNIGREPHTRRLSRFLLVYTLLLTILYSVIPYKTPWCICSIMCGMVLLAGIGVGSIAAVVRSRSVRYIVYCSAAVVAVILAWQSWRLNGSWRSGRGNPYVYIESSPDVKRLTKRLDELARLDRDGYNSMIQVIAPPDRMWPIPWYLRKFRNTGYWTVRANPEIIRNIKYLVTSPGVSENLPDEIKDGYMIEFFGLREDVLIVLHVRKDLWDRYIHSKLGEGR